MTNEKKLFDAKMHTFGMAYYLMLRDGSILPKIDGGDAVVYVLDHGATDCNYAWPDGTLHRTELRWLTRAPEYDLIPRQDVEVLLDGLDKRAKQFGYPESLIARDFRLKNGENK